jgi:hypothetical protein
MVSGKHSHKCEVCGEVYECMQVTHCKRDEPDGPVSVCNGCAAVSS